MLFIQRCVMLEESLVFIFKQVWNVILVLFLAETALATVSGDKLASAGKAVDRQETVVCTALTSCHRGLKLQIIDLVDGQHG